MHPASFLRHGFFPPLLPLSSIFQTDRPFVQPIITRKILAKKPHLLFLLLQNTRLISTKLKHILFSFRPTIYSSLVVRVILLDLPCTTRVFLAPFIGRPFFNGPFHHHHLAQGKEVEASTRTNFSGFFSSLPFPPYLIPSSLPPSSFLQLYSLARQKEEEVFRTPASSRCSTFQSTRFPASERRMLLDRRGSTESRARFRPSKLTPLVFFCDG